MAGGAGGVEHRHAEDGGVDVRAVLGRERFFVGLGALDLAADRQGQAQVAGGGLSRGDGRREGLVGDQDPGFAVVDDVGDFGWRKVPVDRRHASAGALAGDDRLDELRPVPAQQGDTDVGTDAVRPQHAGQAIGVGVQFAERPAAELRQHRHSFGSQLGVHREAHAVGRCRHQSFLQFEVDRHAGLSVGAGGAGAESLDP